MALEDMFPTNYIDDLNTTSNITSAGISMALLGRVSESLDVAKASYALAYKVHGEYDILYKLLVQGSRQQAATLEKILTTLQSIEEKLK